MALASLIERLFTTIRFGSAAGPIIRSGAGSPEGVVSAPVGSAYLRNDGGASTAIYAKGSGAGNTGWVALTGGGGSTDPLILTSEDATATAANQVKLFRRKLAERNMPAFVGPSGLDVGLQPFIARNKIGIWTPPGNATTVPGVFGFTAPTVTNFTAVARTIATTNRLTRMQRLGYNTATTVGIVGHWRHAAGQFTVGNGSGLGGFFYCKRFAMTDVAAIAAGRFFTGMRLSTITPTNVEPSTLLNGFGIGFNAADTNFKIMYGGTTAQTPIDLGANFPCKTLSVDVYELILFCPPNSSDVHWRVERLNTGDVASGTITNSGTAVLPPSTMLIGPWCYKTNNTAAVAAGMDVISAYIETDY